MRTVKLTVMGMGIVGLLFGLTLGAWANMPAPGDECCLVVNPGSGALALKGVIALVYNPFNLNLDVLLRLERSGDQHFFRLNLWPIDLEGLSNEGIVCLVLNPKEHDENAPGDPRKRVWDFVERILSTYFTGRTPDNTRLVITRDSIIGAQGVFACDDPLVEGYDTKLCEIPESIPPRISSMGEVTIYAVDEGRVNFVYPACQLQQ